MDWVSDTDSETDSLSEVDDSSDSEVLTDWVSDTDSETDSLKEVDDSSDSEVLTD